MRIYKVFLDFLAPLPEKPKSLGLGTPEKSSGSATPGTDPIGRIY